jgi:hypothetical protein
VYIVERDFIPKGNEIVEKMVYFVIFEGKNLFIWDLSIFRKKYIEK